MLLQVDGICKAYPAGDGMHVALDDVSLSVDTGETVGLIGASGSGKSTLASVVLGLEPADAGTVAFDGVTCSAALPRRRWPRSFRAAALGMQVVFQHPAASFSERMRIGDAVAEGVAYRGVPRGECEQRALAALEQVGLPRSYAGKFSWELSGGECQRAAIARAIVSGPKLLICDEATSALDMTVQAQVANLLHDLCGEMDMACLFISHDLALVRGFCSRAYVIDSGRIVEHGLCADLFNRPKAEATRTLVSAIVH